MTSVNTDPPNEGVLLIELEPGTSPPPANCAAESSNSSLPGHQESCQSPTLHFRKKENMISREDFFSQSDERVRFLRQVQTLYQRAEEQLHKKTVDEDFYQALLMCSSEVDTPVPDLNDSPPTSICKSILEDVKELDVKECLFSLEKKVFELKSTYANIAKRRPADGSTLILAKTKCDQGNKKIIHTTDKCFVQFDVWSCRYNQLASCIKQNVAIIAKQESELERPLTHDSRLQHMTLVGRSNFLSDSFDHLTEIAKKKDKLAIDFVKIHGRFCAQKPTVTYDKKQYSEITETQQNISGKCAALKQKWSGLNREGENVEKHIFTAENFISIIDIKVKYLARMAATVVGAYVDAVAEVEKLEMLEKEVAFIDETLHEMNLVLNQLQQRYEELDEIVQSDPIFEPSGFEGSLI
ncbi:unnamed protein product [Caenorhabditis brenneri]